MWRAPNFSGTTLRELYTDGLRIELEQSSSGGMDAGIDRNSPVAKVDDVHESAYIAGRMTVAGTGEGFWWYGPKISVDWDDSGDSNGSAGWFENYIIDKASMPLNELENFIFNGGRRNVKFLGTTEHDGSVYKHYYSEFAQWVQFWAVRQEYRNGGVTSIKPILDMWRKNGLVNGRFDGIKLNFETHNAQSRTFYICDFIISANHSVFQADYPENYDENANCDGPTGIVQDLEKDRTLVSYESFKTAAFTRVVDELIEYYKDEITMANMLKQFSNPIKPEEIQNLIDVVNDSSSTDLDNDGISNLLDLCFGTTETLLVDENGCATLDSIVSQSNSPADGGYDIDDLNDLGLEKLKEENMAAYEAAFAIDNPRDVVELQKVVNVVNGDFFESEASDLDLNIGDSASTSSSSGGGGSTPFITLIFLYMGRRYRSLLKR